MSYFYDKIKEIGGIQMKKIPVFVFSVLALTVLSACTSNQKKSATQHSSQSTQVASSQTSKNSTSTSSSQPTSSSSSTTSTSQSSKDARFDDLSTSEKDQILATWLQNSQGQYTVYHVDALTTYFVNDGQNGSKMYQDGQKVGNAYAGISLARQKNSAKFVMKPESVEFYVPSSHSGFDGDWNHIQWQLKETVLKSDLMTKYASLSKNNHQIVDQATQLPS